MKLSNNVIADDLEELNNLYVLNNILINMQKNIELIQQGAQGNNITVNGANLYQLAAQYYGDATLWTTIAQANGLVSPYIIPGNAMTLIIPLAANNTGGILPS